MTGAVFTIDVRFLFMPVLLLLLIALLRKATWTRATAFVMLLIAQIIASPEAGIAAVALTVTLIGFELDDRDPARSPAENFRRTILCASSGAAFVAAWLVFLAAFSALGSFVFYYRTFAPGHELTGGFPIQGAWAPPGISHDKFTYAAVHSPWCSRCLRSPSSRSASGSAYPSGSRTGRWAARPYFMALYYTKFLSRPDHVFESFGVTVPVLLYVVYRAIELLAARMPPRLYRPGTYALTAVALVVTLGYAPVSWRQAVRSIPARFVASVDNEPTLARIGYAQPGPVDILVNHDLVDGEAPDDRLVHRRHLAGGRAAPGDVGLVGDDDESPAGVGEAPAGLGRAGQQHHVVGRARRVRVGRRGPSPRCSTPSRSRNDRPPSCRSPQATGAGVVEHGHASRPASAASEP